MTRSRFCDGLPYTYGYDPDGNRLYKENTLSTSNSEPYAYDNLNRLTTMERGTLNGGKTAITSVTRSESWDLDALGNSDSVTTDGSTGNRDHNSENELTTIGSSSLTFDNNGNGTTDETGKMPVYDAWNRLVEAENSGTSLIRYEFDGHGCHFKTRNSEYKRSGHESSIRVPMAFSGPQFEQGGQVQQIVSLVDLMPTLLDAAGLEIPATVQGRSTLPLLSGVGSDWPKEAFIQISETEIGRAVRTHRWKYGVVAADASLNPEKTSSTDRYIEAYLYDLLADPYELTNLMGFKSHAGVAARMRRRLVQRMRQAGEAEPAFDLAPERAAGQRRVTSEEVEQ